MLIEQDIGLTFIPTYNTTAEELTRRYMEMLEEKNLLYTPNKVLHERMNLPKNLNHIKDIQEREDFKKELFRRWKHGHDGLNGMMYSYFHYTTIRGRAKSGIKPIFRWYDNLIFELAISCLYGNSTIYGDNRKKGIISLGKRSFGKSHDLGHIMTSLIVCNKETSVIITSKGADDAEKFLEEKIKFNYYRYPNYLRQSEMFNSRDTFHIGKKITRNGITEVLGNDSKIITNAPTPEKNEGGGARLWGHDEAPKTKDFRQLYDMTNPALLDDNGFDRYGVPFLIGVAGEFDKFGTDFIDMWTIAEELDLIKFFIPGWATQILDEYGNDKVEEAVFNIFKRRIGYRNNETAMKNDLQQYPMTPEEALMTADAGVLPKGKLIQQRAIVLQNPKPYRVGTVDWTTQGIASMFRPNPAGKVNILEHPVAANRNFPLYVGFIDAYDIKTKNNEGSEGALYIYKRKTNLSEYEQAELLDEIQIEPDFRKRLMLMLRLGEMPVCEYVDAPDDIRTFAENCAKIFVYFGAPTLVEKFPSPIFSHIDEHYREWNQRTPVRPENRLKKADIITRGIKFDEYWKDQRTSFLRSYFEDRTERVYFDRLLKDGIEYDPTKQRTKKDSVDAFGGCLIHSAQSYLKKLETTIQGQHVGSVFGFTRGQGGLLKPTI